MPLRGQGKADRPSEQEGRPACAGLKPIRGGLLTPGTAGGVGVGDRAVGRVGITLVRASR
ncbi:MAG: hypothetical protein ABSD47_09065 [Candidatus Methylomirabilota bacterium]